MITAITSSVVQVIASRNADNGCLYSKKIRSKKNVARKTCTYLILHLQNDSSAIIYSFRLDDAVD